MANLVAKKSRKTIGTMMRRGLMAVKIPPRLMRRHRQSAIVAGLVLLIFENMRGVYQRKKNLNAMLEDMVIACAVRRNDQDGGEPLTVADIAKNLRIPRTNVARATDALIKIGLLRKEGGGFVGDLDYLVANQEAPYFTNLVAAILTAATELMR